MDLSVAELRKLPLEELVRRYDHTVAHVIPNLDFYSNEIARRDAAEETAKIVEMSRQMLDATRQMRDMTKQICDTTQQMRTLTWAIIVLTVVNMLLVGYSLLT